MKLRLKKWQGFVNQVFRDARRECQVCKAQNHAVRSSHTIFQYFQDATLEEGTTSIYELVLVLFKQPVKLLPYKNFRLRDWNIETNHYDSPSRERAILMNHMFWRLYGRNLKILTLSHCKIPFNFNLLPRVLWRAVPNLGSLTLSNCVMQIDAESELDVYPVKLRVLFVRNVTCILNTEFPIELFGIAHMLSNLDAFCVRQREFGAAMHFFNVLKLVPNETIWKRPTPKPFKLRWTGIMNWPRWGDNGLPWNLRNLLTQVELPNDRLIVHFSRSHFQGLKKLRWKSCLCAVLIGLTESCEVDEPSVTNCRHVLFEKAFCDGGETVDMYIPAVNTCL